MLLQPSAEDREMVEDDFISVGMINRIGSAPAKPSSRPVRSRRSKFANRPFTYSPMIERLLQICKMSPIRYRRGQSVKYRRIQGAIVRLRVLKMDQQSYTDRYDQDQIKALLLHRNFLSMPYFQSKASAIMYDKRSGENGNRRADRSRSRRPQRRDSVSPASGFSAAAACSTVSIFRHLPGTGSRRH